MRTPKIGRTRRALGGSLVAITLAALVAMPAAIAVSQPVEQVLRVRSVGRGPDTLTVIDSRLIFPPSSRWVTDPDAGPLTLTVETGKVGVVLDGGLARIERQVSPLQDERISPLPPQTMALLWPGDKLVVSRGYGLRVDNDEDAVATLAITRLSRDPVLPATITDTESA